ncbi:DUF2169 domain-containing protein [Rhodoferax sp.]|uniref:DUF2169 domain-containing protein n=1 Tax=Rhodoferax sp. TaxID=50421 RepID=UPI00277494D7|nr:DUF2169 domain-containing protein [Rhodoferax sp.]
MKIIKPLSLGLLHRTYRQHGENRLVVVGLGFFTLGVPASARLLPEAPQWGRLMKVLPSGQALDEVMPKASAEVMVLGQACAPAGQAVTQLPVRLQLGAIDKRLMVHGDRQWRYGSVPLFSVDPPAPFQSMPLDWAHAYGGPGLEANPLGKGYHANRLAALIGANQGDMPNLEYADAPVRGHGGSYAPAGLGPMPIDWEPRKRYAGSYGPAWLQQDYPGLPRDLDWRLYNQAPLDQRLERLTGCEVYRLSGMHPEHAVLQGTLPSQRVRAFALDHATSELREVALQLDTVWLLPGQQLGVAAWRGQLSVADSDALDVQALLLAYEDSAQAALPPSHYAEVARLRLDSASAGMHAFNESQLAPSVPGTAPAAPDTTAQQARLDEVAQAFWQQSGLTPPADYQPPQAQAPLLQPPSAAAVASGDMDLTGLMLQVQTLQQDTQARAQAQREALQQQLGELHATLADSATHASHDASTAPLASDTSASATTWQQVLARADGSADAQTLASLAFVQSAHCTSATNPADPAASSPAQMALAMKAQARHASPTPIAPAQRLAPDLATQLGAQVLAWVRAGVPLAGRDLSGANLHGAQLDGLDLSGCLLEYADLSGASLRGAQLHGAVLTQATLSRADFSGADLRQANLCASVAHCTCFERAQLGEVRATLARWPGANAAGATLSAALLDQTDLSQACFDESKLDGTVLTQAALTGSTWRGATFNKVVAWTVQAQGADFSRSQWQRSALLGCDLGHSQWQGARLSQLQGGNSDWTGAELRAVKAERCSWPSGQLRGVHFDGAYLSQCDLSRADLGGASLADGCFPKSLFMQTKLVGAKAQGADFFQALLRKADFTRADLRQANLYHAELTEIGLLGANTEGLRLDAQRVLQ